MSDELTKVYRRVDALQDEVRTLRERLAATDAALRGRHDGAETCDCDACCANALVRLRAARHVLASLPLPDPGPDAPI